ncbi:MAG TPA: hypothetical protein VHO06_23290 [Polyangia bacterium]|nr:hypothetical protein [Polyangia bacterium]
MRTRNGDEGPRETSPVSPPRARHGGASLLRALLLAVALSLGCISTSMTAGEVRVPVLLGPVPCIGCRAERRRPAAMPVAEVGGRERAYMLFLPLPPSGLGVADDRQLGISADRLLFGTSCRADLQLSNVRAEAWMLSLPIFYYDLNASVTAEATQVVVPGASCGPP